MFENSQNWEFFGYDIRLLGRHWRAAWREFLWGSESPVLERLDEPVRVHSEEGERHYFAGKPMSSANAAANCDAVLLPADNVLVKKLTLPLAAETDLAAVMDLEISANNPFPPEDTASGWSVISRSGETLNVGLAVASMSAVMSYLARRFDCHDPGAYEVWAPVDDAVVVLQGFGETKRGGRYRQRLVKVAGLLVLCALLLVAISGTYAATSYFKLQRIEEMSVQVEREASQASKARVSLLSATDAIQAVHGYVVSHPSPHVELARLTRLLGDGASIINFSMTGADLQLRGRARDAAEVVQQLTGEPAYQRVTSPQAITKMGDTGYEEFHLDITLAGGETP